MIPGGLAYARRGSVDQPAASAFIVRPMGVGEVLDTGIRLARQNYRLLVTTTAWALVPAIVIGAVLDLLFPFPRIGSYVIILAEWISALAVAIACSHLIAPGGAFDELRPGQLYRAVPGRWVRTLGLAII